MSVKYGVRRGAPKLVGKPAGHITGFLPYRYCALRQHELVSLIWRIGSGVGLVQGEVGALRKTAAVPVVQLVS